jgi:hypothetical protein
MLLRDAKSPHDQHNAQEKTATGKRLNISRVFENDVRRKYRGNGDSSLNMSTYTHSISVCAVAFTARNHSKVRGQYAQQQLARSRRGGDPEGGKTSKVRKLTLFELSAQTRRAA